MPNFTERMEGLICIFLNIRLCNPASVGLSVNWEEMRAEGRQPSEKKREHILTTPSGGAWNWLSLNVDTTQWGLHFTGQEWKQKFLAGTT